MKQKLLLSALFLLCFNFAYSQKKNKKTESNESEIFISTALNVFESPIKVNFTTSFNTTIFSGNFEHSYERENMMNIGLGFQKRKLSGWFYEISLSKLSVRKNSILVTRYDEGELEGIPISGNRSLSVDFASRFEYGKYFLDTQKNKFNIGLSIGAETYFLYDQLTPANSSGFPWKNYRVGTSLQFIPILSFQPSKKIVFDFKVIPNFFNFFYKRFRINNPNLALRQQVEKSFDVKLLESVSFGLNVRYRLK